MEGLNQHIDALLDEHRPERYVRPLSVGSERVQLRAASVTDLELWAIDERRVAAQEFASRSFACDGAEWCADQMRAHGWLRFADGCEATR